MDKTHDKTKTIPLKGKGEGKGYYIMYKYIIFFGVMSRNIIRGAQVVGGLGTGRWEWGVGREARKGDRTGIGARELGLGKDAD